MKDYIKYTLKFYIKDYFNIRPSNALNSKHARSILVGHMKLTLNFILLVLLLNLLK